MTDSKAPTIICVASFFKGNDFIRECKRLGAAVVLLTRQKLLDADWARESLDDLIAIPGKTSVQSYLAAATYVAGATSPGTVPRTTTTAGGCATWAGG